MLSLVWTNCWANCSLAAKCFTQCGLPTRCKLCLLFGAGKVAYSVWFCCGLECKNNSKNISHKVLTCYMEQRWTTEPGGNSFISTGNPSYITHSHSISVNVKIWSVQTLVLDILIKFGNFGSALVRPKLLSSQMHVVFESFASCASWTLHFAQICTHFSPLASKKLCRNLYYIC